MKRKAAKQWMRYRLARGKKWQRLIGWRSSIQLTFSAPVLALAVGLAGAVLTPQVKAATLTWDPLNTGNGATIDDGAGDWNAANVWNNAGVNQSWSSAPPDIAIFTGTVGGTITGDATTGGITVNGTANYLFSGNLSGTGTLAKSGTGTLTLTGANTYTGATTIAANSVINIQSAGALGVVPVGISTTTVTALGALQIQGNISVGAEQLNLNGTGVGGTGALRNMGGNNAWTGAIVMGSSSRINSDAGTLTVAGNIFGGGNNFGLTIGGSGDTVISGVIGTSNISSAGTLTKDGAGTLVLSGVNTYTGATTISAGVVNIQNVAALGTTSGGASVAAGAALQIQNDIAVGTEGLTLNGSGIANDGALRNLSGNNSWAGGITLGSAARINADAGTTLSLGGNIAVATFGLTVGGAGNTTVNGALTGTTGTLTKDGTGTLILAGNNTNTGATTLTAGTLQLGAGGNTGALGSGAVSLAAGTSLVINRSDTLTMANAISGAGTVTLAGPGTVNFTSAKTYTGATAVNAGTLNLTGSLTSAITVASGATLTGTAATTGNITLNAGSGILLQNTATGSVTGANVSASSPVNLFVNGSATGAVVTRDVIAYTGTSPGTAAFAASAANYRSGLLTQTTPTAGKITLEYRTDNKTWNQTGGGTWDVNGASSPWSGGIDGKFFWGDVVTFGATAANQTITLAGPLAPAAINVTNATNSYTFDGTGGIVGAATLTKSGAGTLIFANSGANTYTGATTISAGTLQIGNGLTIGSLSAASTITNNGSLVFNRSNTLSQGVDFGAIVGGTGTVTQSGTGTTVLNAANAYTGLTTVSSGVLNIRNGSALGTTAAGTIVNSGAALEIQGGINVGTEALTLSGSGISGGGALRNVSGSNSIGGNITLASAATINSDSGVLNLSGAINNGGNLLTFGGAGDILATGLISGAGGLTKNGTGTLTLFSSAASSTFTGDVNINQGKVLLLSGNGLGRPSNVTVASGATLQLDGGQGTLQPLTLVLNGFGAGGAGALRIGGYTGNGGNGTTAFGGTATKIVLGSDSRISYVPTNNPGTGSIASQLGIGILYLDNHTLYVDSAVDSANHISGLQISNSIRGTGGLIVDGTGTVSLSPQTASTFTGQTWVKSGILNIRTSGLGTLIAVPGDTIAGTVDLLVGDGVGTDALILGSSNMVGTTVEIALAPGGMMTLNSGITNTIGSLASSSTASSLVLTSATSTLTVANGNGGTDGSGNTTFAGVVSGLGNLAKTRSGTFTLTGANTYAGTTTVSQGVINIQNALALGGTTAGTTVASGAALQLQNGAGMTVAGEALTLSGFGVANDGALRNIDGNNTWAGAVTLTGSTRINSDADLLTLTNTIGGVNQNLTVGGDGDTAITGAIATGTGGLIKDGTGTLTLSGINTYTGTTAVNGGTLLLDFSVGGTTNIIDPSSALSMGGGTLAIKGGAGETNVQTFNGLSGTGGTLSLNANGATSLTANLGDISRTGAYNFTGADTTVSSVVPGVPGLAVPGVSNYTTTTIAGANNGLGRIGASLWNGSTWASTATDGAGTTYVVPWNGVFVNLTTNSFDLTPASFTNTTGDLRIIDGTATGTAVTYNTNTTVSSLFMVAPTFDTTVAITTGTILNFDDGSGFGSVAIGGAGKSLTLGNVVNQGVITSGTTAGAGLTLRNTNPTSVLTVNAVVGDNAGGAVSLNTAGSVVLLASNSYTGDTGISAGTLQIAGAGSLGGGNYAGAIVNDGLLQYSSSINQTLTGAISGGGGLTKDGTGNLVLSGANNYTGDTTIATGTLQIAGTGTLGSGNYVGAIANDGTLQYSSSSAQTLAGAISGTGSLLKDGSGTLNLTGTNTYTGGTTIATGILRIAGAGSLGNGSYAPSIVDNGTLQYSSSTTQILTGNITGTGSLVKDGVGTLILTGSNAYAGPTTVNGGTLQLDFAAGGTTNIAPSASALSLNGGTLQMKGGAGEANTQAFNGLSGTGGTLLLTQDTATSVNLSLGSISTSGAYRFIGGDTTLSGFNAVPGNANFITTTQVGANDAATKLGASIWTFSDGSPDTWASTAADTGGTTYVVPWNGTFTNLTTNSFTLTPASYTNTTGDLRINDGTAAATAVSYNADTTIGSLLMVAPSFSTTVAVTAGTTLTVGSGDGAVGSVAISSKGLGLTLGDTVNQGVITAGTGLSASTLVLQNLDTVQNPGTLLTVNSVIANNTAGGEVSLTTSGAVVLAATNTYTGDTAVSSGTLRIAGGGTLGSGAYAGEIANNGTLRYSSSAAQTLSGVISGGGGITKDTSGTSTLTLTGANTYDGATTLSSGVLNIQNDSALGSTAEGTSVTAGATLQLQGNIAVGAEALTLNGTGAGVTGALRNVSGNNSWAGPVTLATASRINSDAGLLMISGAISGVDRSLTVGGTGDTTLSGAIGTAAGTLTKDGTGTLTLTGNSAGTFTGATTVTAGTLAVNGSIANSAVTVNTGATLIGTGTVGATTINTGGTLDAGSVGNPGILNVNGNLGITGNYRVDIAGLTAGTGYDQTKVLGTVTLGGGATLTLNDPSFAVPGGNTLTIIDNDGIDAVSGIFTGLTAGTAINAGASNFKIFYDGGDGNDVVLVSTTLPAPLYINNEWTSVATVDGDQELAGSQAAYVGINAFDSLSNALATYSANNGGANYAGDIFVNGGTYSDANLAGGAAVTLQLVSDGGNAQPDVTFQNLTGDANDAIVTQFHGTAGNGDLIVEQGSFAGVISGGGDLTKTTAGTLTLSGTNTYTGATNVDGGTLNVTGSIATSSLLTVNTGGTLTGTGTVGVTNVASGGTLANNVGSTLTLGATTLDPNATTSVGLGTASNPALFAVNGNLTLDGKLDITDAGGFSTNGTGATLITPGQAPVVYHLYTYTGSLTNNGLAINTLPAGADPSRLIVQTAINGQVNLIDTNGAVLTYWDGDNSALYNNNQVNGGNGVWTGSSPNWTDPNGIATATKAPNSYAYFAGSAGTVTVDDVTAGQPEAQGMYFDTNGYVLNGGSILLANGGNGSLLDASAGVTATINSNLTGTEDLNKTGDGTIVLGGTNAYTGDTTVTAGTLNITGSIASDNVNIGTGATLAVSNGTAPGALKDTAAVISAGTGAFVLGNDETIGSLAGDGTVNLNSNTLTTGGNNTSTSYAGVISGTGDLTKEGTGTMTLSGANDYTGDTNINGGTLQIGGSGSLGGGNYGAAINNNGVLQYSSSANQILSGSINGPTGTLTKDGTGSLTLSGSSTLGTINHNVGNLAITGSGAVTTGAFTQLAGATLTLDATAPGIPLTVSNSVSLAGALNLQNVSNLSGAVNKVLISVGNTATINGTFDVAEGTELAVQGGFRYLFSYMMGDGNDIGIVAIPLPPTGNPELNRAVQNLMRISQDSALGIMDDIEDRVALHRRIGFFEDRASAAGHVAATLASSAELPAGLSPNQYDFAPDGLKHGTAYATVSYGQFNYDNGLEGNSERYKVGYDALLRRDAWVGAEFSYGRMDWNMATTSGDLDAYRLSAYGTWEFKSQWFLDGGVGAGLLDLSTERSGGLKGDLNGWDTYAFGRLAWRVIDHQKNGAISRLEPFVGLRAVHTELDGFTESGGTSPYAVSSQSSNLGQVFAGVNWSQWFDAPQVFGKDAAWGYHARLQGFIGAADQAKGANMILIGAGSPMAVDAPDADNWGGRLTLGTDYRVGDWTISADASVSETENTDSWQTKLNVSWWW